MSVRATLLLSVIGSMPYIMTDAYKLESRLDATILEHRGYLVGPGYLASVGE